MGRVPRIEFTGAIYHITQRGNNKEFVFKDNVDKGYFINLVKETKEAMGFKVYSYVIMDNHYHLAIQTLDKPLHIIMHYINNKYSKYFNCRFEHIGHVFQGRYRATLVQDESYLLSLIKYIHRNPVRANMCSSPHDYSWSSDLYYRTNINSIINIDTVLDILSKNRVDAIRMYKEYMMKEELAE